MIGQYVETRARTPLVVRSRRLKRMDTRYVELLLDRVEAQLTLCLSSGKRTPSVLGASIAPKGGEGSRNPDQGKRNGEQSSSHR